MNSNFGLLRGRWQSLGKLGQEAEQYVTSDPSVALFKLRLYAEKMTDEILRLEGINSLELDNQVDKLGKLEEEQLLSAEILKMFHDIRKAGNRAAHTGEGTVHEARMRCDQASYLGSWFVKHYLGGNGSKKQKMFGRNQHLFVRIRPLWVSIPVVILIIWVGTVLISFFSISANGGLDSANTENTISEYTKTAPSEDITLDVTPENYDGTIYINNKPIDAATSDKLKDYPVLNIDVGSKVHAEWTFPWGKMKSDTQQVEEGSDSMEFQAKADPQLRKKLIDFFNKFAKQCIRERQKDTDDPDLGKFVSGYLNYTCEDVSIEHNEKLIETGIDFKNSRPEIETLAFSDPYLIFMLYAYFKYEVDGVTQTHHGGFRLVYDETKKSWSIESENVHQGEFEDNPEAIITKFK
jgi:hypothetical protein